MTTLENIIRNYNVTKEGGLTHRKSFLGQGDTTRNNWYNRRRYSI